MKNDSGFSLVELIIVIAIMAILAGIAIPNFMAWVPKYRVKGAAQDLYSNIQMAKMEAIKRNQSCTVTFSTAPDQYVIGLINKTVPLEDGVRFTAAPAPAAITFNSRGFANSAVTVSLTNSQNSATYQVSILSSGVVSIN